MNESTKWFLMGLVVLALGIVVLGNAATASAAVVTVTGILLLLGGVLQIVVGFWSEGTRSRLFAWALGALTLFMGWSFLSNPLAGALSLTTVILLLFLAAGIAQLLFSFRLKGTVFFWVLLGSGGLSILLAMVLLSSPEATMDLIGILLGLQLLSSGASLVSMGMFLRSDGA